MGSFQCKVRCFNASCEKTWIATHNLARSTTGPGFVSMQVAKKHGLQPATAAFLRSRSSGFNASCEKTWIATLQPAAQVATGV